MIDLPVVTVPDEWRDQSPDPRWLTLAHPKETR